MASYVRIRYRPTGRVLAEGPIGWGITPFEGSYYVRRKYLRVPFRMRPLPGLCPYKGLYLWATPRDAGPESGMLSWIYVLPNPLFPFVCFRYALPQEHPLLEIERLGAPNGAGTAASVAEETEG